MYELTLKSLKQKNEEIKRKIPTIEESIHTYESMCTNYRKELEEIKALISSNEEAIKLLESMEDDNK